MIYLSNRHLFLEKRSNEFTTCVLAAFYRNKLLILQRGDTAPWMPNKWSLVGGVVDTQINDTEMNTMNKEAYEEIGQIPVVIRRFKKIKTNDIGNIVYYVGKLRSDNIKLDYENKAYKFIDLSQVDDYDFVPYVKEYIKFSFRMANWWNW